MAEVIIVIAQEGFQDKEFSDTKEAISKAGFRCDVASSSTSIAKGKLGLEIHPDITIEDALIGLDMYRAVVFIGGPGAVSYFDDAKVQGLAKIALDKEKLVCAICIAPMILAKAGLLKGRRATVWDGDGKQSEYFGLHGIEYTSEDVTVDENIITANGPEAALAFGEKIAELLS